MVTCGNPCLKVLLSRLLAFKTESNSIVLNLLFINNPKINKNKGKYCSIAFIRVVKI